MIPYHPFQKGAGDSHHDPSIGRFDIGVEGEVIIWLSI